MQLVKFMASQNGRILRVVVGVLLILLGLLIVQDTAGIIIALIGIIPAAAGIFDVCLFAPLIGAPLKGPEIRREVETEE